MTTSEGRPGLHWVGIAAVLIVVAALTALSDYQHAEAMEDSHLYPGATAKMLIRATTKLRAELVAAHLDHMTARVNLLTTMPLRSHSPLATATATPPENPLHSPPPFLTATPSTPPRSLASRYCNSTAAADARGGSAAEVFQSSALHVAFLAVGGVYGPAIRRIVLDIVAHTGDDSDIVIHLLVSLGSDSMRNLLPFMPLCDRVAIRWWDTAAFYANHSGAARVCRDVMAAHALGCLYMIKPFLHEVLPPSLGAVLVLDADLRVVGDVRELLVVELEAQRRNGAVLGLAVEMQPEYLEAGLGRGFNGGVQLLDLHAMAHSPAYRGFLANGSWGYIQPSNQAWGDQTFYTLINVTMERVGQHLIHEISCGWNLNLQTAGLRQPDMFTKYPFVHLRECTAPVRIVHGNGRVYQQCRLMTMGDAELLEVVRLNKAYDFTRNTQKPCGVYALRER